MNKLTILLVLINISPLVKAADVADPVVDFKSMEHVNPGCPINSECSKTSGKAILKWENFISKINEKNKVKKLTQYLLSHGLPLDFLTKKEAKVSLDPIMWNSRCKIHNPKNNYNSVYKGRKFLKKIPRSDHLKFTPITTYFEGREKNYLIPYQDQPILISKGRIVTLRDYDDFYYQIGLNPNGSISIENIPTKIINLALRKKINEIECPKKMDINEAYFSKSYCQKIYDIDLKKLITLQYGWSCP